MRLPTPTGAAPTPRAWAAAPASVVAASLLATLPVVADAAVLPPFGLLMALAWRLLRPELWPAWAALPLGLFDDLACGQPLGSGMALWTLAFLTVDWLDRRVGLRDHWFDWLIAAVLLILVVAGGALAAGTAPASMVTILPQTAITVLFFPAAARVAAAIDRWRLAR